MEYIDFSAGQTGSQEAADDRAVNAAQHYNAAAAAAAAAAAYGVEPPKGPPYMNSNFPGPITCDIKPRLTKEQHDILEAHFQKQNKPNTTTKKTFAESLNVSLDKVNNWFQNRRAKLKQDAKKHQGTLNLYHGQSHPASDSETSPGFVDNASQYHAMMQNWATEQRAPNGLGISQAQHSRDQISPQGISFEGVETATAPYPVYNGAVHSQPDMFSSQEELNRRTLTQEQFDAMERNGGMLNGLGTFEDFEASFNGNHAVMNSIFPDFGDYFKPEDMMNYPIGAPMTSYDSTIPSNISAESLPIFPPSSQLQPYATMSASGSEWSDSRSSSIHSATTMQQQSAATTSQWQPGQSIPVDANQQQEEFRQVAARASHARTSPQQPMHEPPLPWGDDALIRRDSSASLVQSMGDVGIQTPPQHQNGTFKSPAPPANIAARRQRPRPAALGLTAMRSQSHSGAVLPGSPSTIQHQTLNPADQQLRRIRSSNWIGGVAPGRVMKSMPGSAQRSPLNYTFAEAMNSPHAVRHASLQSHGSLAPPTPLSPKEPAGMDEVHQHWQAPFNSGRHASITETDAEHLHNYQARNGIPTHNWTTSPPHTPMFHQHQAVSARFRGHTVMENTPPQSAPASQTSFPSTFVSMAPPPPQQQLQSHTVPSQSIMQQRPMSVVPVTQPPPQFAHPSVPDQQFQMSNVVFAPAQQLSMQVSGPPPGIPIHFANGVPITNAEGNIEMMFPSAQHFLQHSQGHTPPQHMHTPPQATYHFVASSAGGSPNSQTTSQSSNKSSTSSSSTTAAPAELFVHEYTPPEAVKRAATPRKGPVDTVPKNYAFANTGPEHFEEKKPEERKAKSKASVTSSSPASSIGTTLTSTS